MGKLEILADLKYDRDPLQGEYVETKDAARVKRILNLAVESKALIAIVGDPGFGKTRATNAALREMEISPVRIMAPEKEGISIADIERALIMDLSQENPKRSREVRARQLRRIMGEASRERRIVLVIEEAHRIHGQTLRALKSLREMEWMGKAPLITVVLLAQYDPFRGLKGLDEVRLRADTLTMRGLNPDEIKTYVQETVGRSFEEDAVDALSRLEQARNFLGLHEMIVALLGKALKHSRTRVNPVDIFEAYKGGMQEIRKRTGLTVREMADKLSISPAAVSLLERGKQGELSAEFGEKNYEQMADLLRGELGEGKSKPLRAVNAQ